MRISPGPAGSGTTDSTLSHSTFPLAHHALHTLVPLKPPGPSLKALAHAAPPPETFLSLVHHASQDRLL